MCKMFIVKAAFFILAFFSNKCLTRKIDHRFYPYYHLAPPFGWMNDPNGFCVFNNEFHMFYQHNPETSQEPGIAHWGHAKSPDLFHWEHLDIALYPDKDYDRSGVFSGSAVIVNETMNLLYTGNINHSGEDPDHTQRQALAISTDGLNFEKYSGNPVITGEEYQPNLRDPKVWKHYDTFYMVLGNSFDNDSRGRVILFSSKDLISWQNEAVLDESDGSLGYMWECPDFFELNGFFILLFSPQGVNPQGDNYRNLFQTGYIVGNFSYESKVFTPVRQFQELDHGHDLYATQTILSGSRRIVVAWFDMWEQIYPERNDGWAGHLTIPRELLLTPDLRLIQKPVEEIKNIRSGLLYSNKAPAGTTVKLVGNAGEIKIKAIRNMNFSLSFVAVNTTVTISYDFDEGKITLDRGGNDGIRRTEWKPTPSGPVLQIFVDRSSIEVFCGQGEVTMSSRFFPYGDVSVNIGRNSNIAHMKVYSLKRTIR